MIEQFNLHYFFKVVFQRGASLITFLIDNVLMPVISAVNTAVIRTVFRLADLFWENYSDDDAKMKPSEKSTNNEESVNDDYTEFIICKYCINITKNIINRKQGIG